MELKNDCLKKIRALADDNRLKIANILMRGPSFVNAISEELSLEQYNVSKHLRILEQAGLIFQKKSGQKRIYSLADSVSKNLAKNKNKLVLRCCSFDFNKLTV
ncbi:MAG: metalloregulator ArsR/SmtB family transcription factor [Candidatus Omnitrophota bacterium]